MGSAWDKWVDEALELLDSRNLIRSLRPIYVPVPVDEVETFHGPRPSDRSAVEVEVEASDFAKWVGGDGDLEQLNGYKHIKTVRNPSRKKLVLFSGNDYLGLSTHPAVCEAAAKASKLIGMGPRGSSLICGYTSYHQLLESSLADLKQKEDCLLCPTGFAANTAFISSLGSLVSLLGSGKEKTKNRRVAIFSDSLNHASIIDGLRLIQRQHEVEVYVYRHRDTIHLDDMLSGCEQEMKVVITDSLFSMDGDFAPLLELVKLRRRHGFLLTIDDAHGSFVCGDNGGGVPELYDCVADVDICIGTLSKATGCLGGFIACSKRWKILLQSTSRSFIFSTAVPVPIAAAAHAAIIVSRTEKWRRRLLWDHVQHFSNLTKLPITSPIISVVLGSEESALRASRYMLKHGFHVIAVRPPSVPPNSCRLRLTLSAAHSSDDIRSLTGALLQCIQSTYSTEKASILQGSKL